MGSIFKKIRSITKDGIEPIEEGMKNFKTGELDDLARERSEVCKTCPAKNYVNEPIDFLRVEDSRIPSLSEKMCDDCGCALPYLLRQNIKICKYWDDSKV